MNRTLPAQRGATRVLLAGLTVAVASMAVAALYGAKPLSVREVWESVIRFDPSRDADLIVWYVRMPRVVMGALVGASLAVAGAILQSITQNPLACPALSGLSGGGSLAVLVAILLRPGLNLTEAMGASFAGAAAGMTLVYLVASASRSGPTPVRLALAGITVSAVLMAVANTLVHLYTLRFEDLYWTVGGLNNVVWQQVAFAAPVVLVALGVAMLLGPQWTVMGLGREVATGLGVSTNTVRAVGMLLVLLLAGTAVSVAGPVGFVGLLVPHLSRMLVGVDYRKVIPLSASLGAALVVLPDIFCRLSSNGFYPVGMFTSLVGGLFFVILARRGFRGW